MALAVALAVTVPVASTAQSALVPGGPSDFALRRGVGYTAIFPEAWIGGGAFHMLGSSGWGLYADAQTSGRSVAGSSRYLASETVASIEALSPSILVDIYFLGQSEEWLAVHGGIMRALTPHVAVIAGAGATRHLVFREYTDQSGDFYPGRFIVRHEGESGWSSSFSLATLIRTGNRTGILAGVQSGMRSIVLGAFIGF